MRKTWIAGSIAGAVVILFGGAYFGSPYMAAKSLADAAQAGDKDKLDAMVDFPSVRDGLKSQFNAALTANMQNDPDMKDNPFAGLGMMIPAITDRMVDSVVTPDGIAAMVKARRSETTTTAPTPAPTSSSKDDDTVRTYSYINLDRFRASAAAKSNSKQHVDFVFERRNLFTWKLVKIDMSEFLIGADAGASINTD